MHICFITKLLPRLLLSQVFVSAFSLLMRGSESVLTRRVYCRACVALTFVSRLPLDICPNRTAYTPDHFRHV